jgi:hypothetical protein
MKSQFVMKKKVFLFVLIIISVINLYAQDTLGKLSFESEFGLAALVPNIKNERQIINSIYSNYSSEMTISNFPTTELINVVFR